MRYCNISLFLALLSGAIISSCSTFKESGKIPFKSDPNFDASTYVKPGNHIKAQLYDADNYRHVVTDSSYSFPEFKDSPKEIHEKMNYPSRARRSGIQGVVVLKIFIDSTGTPTNMEVAQSPHKWLSRASVKTAAKVTYTPATLNGKAVNSFAFFPFYYQTFTRRSR